MYNKNWSKKTPIFILIGFKGKIMNNKKDVSGLGICSIVFGGLGICFFLAGVISFLLITDDNVKIISYIFSGIGIVFIVLTILLFSIKRNKKKMQEKLISEGNYVMSDIKKIFMNVNITYGNEHPYKIYCTYVDTQGVSHKFRSKNIMFNPNGLIDEESQIRVYVNSSDYSRYYVDTESIIPDESHCVVEGKPLNRNKAYFIMGMMFTLLSVIPICLGVMLYMRFYEILILIITLLCALPFLCVGIGFLINEIHKKKIIRKCREDNQYVMAKVVSVGRDPAVELTGMAGTAMVVDALKNGSNDQPISTEPYYLQCLYQSGDGVKHVFRTGIFFKSPSEDVIGKEVKVYYYGSDMKKYFIDE